MKTVMLLCGGVSCEHEISLLSVQAIHGHLNPDLYAPLLVGISKQGKWLYFADMDQAIRHPKDANRISLNEDAGEEVIIDPSSKKLLAVHSRFQPIEQSQFDIIFPALHGPYGEDGSLQGYFQLFHLPFIGADCLGSAVSMDKGVMKRLLKQAGIAVPPFVVIHKSEAYSSRYSYRKILETLKLPIFIKPCNLGSSVGIYKVHNEEEFNRGLSAAFEYDQKIILEQGISGRELECSVLGNASPRASRLGEIIPKHSFYSYEAKYLDPDGAALIVPAKLDETVEKRARELAIQAFRAVDCTSMARVDMFLESSTQELYINELNTIPGFTSISMYPKLWEAAGLSFQELVSELIELGWENFENRQGLKKSL
jgi:D-alanine-D-alanine ligase